MDSRAGGDETSIPSPFLILGSLRRKLLVQPEAKLHPPAMASSAGWGQSFELRLTLTMLCPLQTLQAPMFWQLIT